MNRASAHSPRRKCPDSLQPNCVAGVGQPTKCRGPSLGILRECRTPLPRDDNGQGKHGRGRSRLHRSMNIPALSLQKRERQGQGTTRVCLEEKGWATHSEQCLHGRGAAMFHTMRLPSSLAPTRATSPRLRDSVRTCASCGAERAANYHPDRKDVPEIPKSGSIFSPCT